MSSTWAADVGIALERRGDVPIGVQLAWGIRAAIASGRLRPGERLPALRDLAAELAINHNTLRAAVARLEAEGILESRHGSGTFVAAQVTSRERHGALVDEVVRQAGDAGMSPRELAAALYVMDPGAADRDAEAEERRALREDIAVLDRLVVQLEARLPRLLPPDGALERTGSRLLTTEELRAQRDALVRRLATVQDELNGGSGEDEGPPEGKATEAPATGAPGAAPAREPLRAPRPGISPA
jgi:DNA-binding transcriptional regulator YhcF (GntR family)